MRPQFRVPLECRLYSSAQAPRLAFPAELTSMFALPAANVHVCRAISPLASLNLHAQAAHFACPNLTPPPRRRTELNADLLGTIFIRSQRPAADVHVAGSFRPSLRRELSTSLHKSLPPTANHSFHILPL